MAGICIACFDLWALYSDYSMVCFFRKAFLKSDTVVALRRRISLIPFITVVFSSTFMMSISVNWCSSLHFHRMFWRQNITTCQCKQRFLDINMNCIEQKIHVLCNMKSYECHLMKIIKGLWLIFISISAFCDSSLWLEKWLCFSVTRCRSNIIVWCAFVVKPFWNRTPWWDSQVDL